MLALSKRLAILFAAGGLLAACDSDSWFGGHGDPPLPGTRVSILDQASVLTPDAPNRTVVLPPPEIVPDWPEAGGFPPHAMWHLALGANVHPVWTADVGAGSAKRRAFLTQPIVAGGKVYAMDAESNVSAFDLKTGGRLWRVGLAVKDADEGTYGGGLAFDGGALYITTGFGQIVSLNPANGKIRWQKNLPAPVRGAPTARAGRLLLITIANETLALAEDDGRELWTHNGIEQETALMGGPSAAVSGNTVVVPYTSGELFALRIENGTQLWSDSLAVLKRTNEVATLTDIRGLPVVDKGRVFAAGNSDTLVAIDLATGRRLWDREVGSVQTPWIAGDFLYVISNAPAVVCFRADTGQVVWVTPLAQWDDPENKSGRIVWTGPLLASDRLIVASSTGLAYSISPYTGKVLGQVELPAGVTIAPILADKTLIFVTDSGELVAYR
jgi:outer membrane protein assembly factor BamB